MTKYEQVYANFCFDQGIPVDWDQLENFLLIWKQYEIAASYPNFRDFMSFIGIEITPVNAMRETICLKT